MKGRWYMKPDSKKESERWFKQSQRDLSDAQFNYGGARYNLVCFLAQQAAEKALKAYLYAQGAEEVWGHSVGELCADARALDSSFEELTAAETLDQYYIPTRYPNGLPGGIPSDVYKDQDAQQALSRAKTVLEFVMKKLDGGCRR